MFRRLMLAAALAGLAAGAAPASAQERPGIRPLSTATLFDITPYVGYMAFGDFLTGPLGTTLSTRNGAVYGAQLGMHITPNLSLVGNVGYSSSDLQVGVPILGGVSVGSAGVWLYDGDLQLDIPVGDARVSPITPFVQVGAGAIHYKIDAANVVATHSTNFAFNAGVGFDYRVTPTMGLRLMAKDYIGKFDFKDATGFDVQGRTAQNWAITAGFAIGF
jgi:hypothetical protein